MGRAISKDCCFREHGHLCPSPHERMSEYLYFVFLHAALSKSFVEDTPAGSTSSFTLAPRMLLCISDSTPFPCRTTRNRPPRRNPLRLRRPLLAAARAQVDSGSRPVCWPRRFGGNWRRGMGCGGRVPGMRDCRAPHSVPVSQSAGMAFAGRARERTTNRAVARGRRISAVRPHAPTV